MSARKHLPKIQSLTDEYPFTVHNLQPIGCRLAEGVQLQILVRQNGDSFQAGICFHKDGDTKEFLFAEELDLDTLPVAQISTATLAEAMSAPSTGFDPKGLVEHIFAAVISLYGETTIELEGHDPESSSEGEFDVFIGAGQFSASRKFTFSELSEFLEYVDEFAGEGEEDDVGDR